MCQKKLKIKFTFHENEIENKMNLSVEIKHNLHHNLVFIYENQNKN